jgi:hypothetical protein
MSQDFRETLDLARKSAEIESAQFELVSPYQYEDILHKIVRRFVKLDLRFALEHLWWWEVLHEPTASLRVNYKPSLLGQLLFPNERVWFVAENFGKSKKQGSFWLYEGTVKAIIGVLEEAHDFEYYLVSKKYDWLLCKNHHDVIISSGEKIVQKLASLKDSEDE